ncbi:MAG TPA: glycosyltransferase family 4 protein, partial [Solirubrobacteraceae bacterium]|nr:glycosyltransferase family 4 protein [Solirubrobacteraceae bacterium]
PLPAAWRSRASHVPIGVDAAAYSPAPAPRPRRLVQLGALAPYKGVRETVEAFARAHRAVPGSELVLAGDGPQREEVERLVGELGLDGAVRVLGARPHDEIAAVLRDARALVSASHGEPFGLAVLEAMATGLAVIAVDEGGPRTIVVEGEGGLHFPRGDVAALAERMERLLTDDELAQRMGAANRRRVEERFSLDVVVPQLEAAFERARR